MSIFGKLANKFWPFEQTRDEIEALKGSISQLTSAQEDLRSQLALANDQIKVNGEAIKALADSHASLASRVLQLETQTPPIVPGLPE